VVGSGVHGRAGSETVCAIAGSPLGTYVKQDDFSEKNTWNPQVSDLVYLEGPDAVLALSGQWWIPDMHDKNTSRYLFLPLYFNPGAGIVKMKYCNEWFPFKPPVL